MKEQRVSEILTNKYRKLNTNEFASKEWAMINIILEYLDEQHESNTDTPKIDKDDPCYVERNHMQSFSIEETKDKVNLTQEFSGAIWAKEFAKIYPMILKDSEGAMPSEEVMLTWFCNAIMAGYDYHANKISKLPKIDIGKLPRKIGRVTDSTWPLLEREKDISTVNSANAMHDAFTTALKKEGVL